MQQNGISSRTNRTSLRKAQREIKTFRKSFIKNGLFHKEFKSSKSQSAMEYLMTYGWAILIIAIVMVALFQLGIFNTQEPRAQAGACEVYHGSDVGECQGVWPQFVAVFNGQSSYINLGNSNLLSPEAGSNGKMTICGWFDVLSLNNYHGFLIKGESSPSNGNDWEYAIGQWNSESYIVWPSTGAYDIAQYVASLPAANTWYFTCFVYNYLSSNSFVFINGNVYQATFSSGTAATAGTGDLILGSGESGFSNIELANFQLYNVSLSQLEIQALYQEGIGGAPVDPNHIVGWWPLNGNAQDYSGNGNQGTATAVTYTSTWTNGYTQP